MKTVFVVHDLENEEKTFLAIFTTMELAVQSVGMSYSGSGKKLEFEGDERRQVVRVNGQKTVVIDEENVLDVVSTL